MFIYEPLDKYQPAVYAARALMKMNDARHAKVWQAASERQQCVCVCVCERHLSGARALSVLNGEGRLVALE